MIGNSDNKLTQIDWTRFCRDITWIVENHGAGIRFSAPSIGWLAYQNACWVFEIREEELEEVKSLVRIARKQYLQDSVAIIVGETEFI